MEMMMFNTFAEAFVAVGFFVAVLLFVSFFMLEMSGVRVGKALIVFYLQKKRDSIKRVEEELGQKHTDNFSN